MSQNTLNEKRFEAASKQYRDWLIPAALFVAVDASIVLFVLSITEITDLLIVSASLATASLFSFVLSLWWAFMRLEAIEMFGSKAEDDGTMFVLSILGSALLCLSLNVLTFWKSKLLGIVITVIFMISILLVRELNKLSDRLDAA